MKRIIIAATIAFLAVTAVSTELSNDVILHAFAASDTLSQLIRLGLIGLLTTLLVTSPPRSFMLRMILGVVSILLFAGDVITMSQYYLEPLDALIFFEVAIILGMEALETTYAPVKKVGRGILKPTRPKAIKSAM